MNRNSTNEWVMVGLFAIIIFLMVMIGFFPKGTLAYKEGVKDTHKEAFEHGLMVKEIDKDDKVIYLWIELPKQLTEVN